MKWYLIDDCTTKKGSVVVYEMNARTREEAQKELESEWGQLTKYDKSRRDSFSAVYGFEPFEAYDIIEM